MREIILAKYGELALKGLNKGSFESALIKTVKRRVACAGEFSVRHAQSTIYIQPENDDSNVSLACELTQRVFGLSAINRAAMCEKSFDAICETAVQYLAPQLSAAKTFKVDAKRSDKSFPLDSMQIGAQLGGYILERFPHLQAEMKRPQLTVTAEVRDFGAYVHCGNIGAAGGMPSGTSGRAAVMLSGGIDSPVAAYMMAKRGLDLVAVHFQSPPYTSERALQKVYALACIVSRWCGCLPVFAVPFTDIQLRLREKCPEQLFTVLMRRSMVRVTQYICEKEQCRAMITGESLAQVASQTLDAIACTNAAASIPVLRPLIGMDKTEIVEIARKIDSFETSILPYEDCCTVFTPKHPKTRPQLEEIVAAEQAAQIEELERQAAQGAVFRIFHFSDQFKKEVFE